MGKLVDLKGQKFGRLTVIRQAGFNSYGNALWLCKCSCGNSAIAASNELRRGAKKSCGCLATKNLQELRKAKFKPNAFFVEGKTVYVRLNNCNDVMLCDLEVWSRLKYHSWNKDNLGYARSGDSKKKYRFHSLVMKCGPNEVIDHINRDRLDNRRSNLRAVNHSQNAFNCERSDRAKVKKELGAMEGAY